MVGGGYIIISHVIQSNAGRFKGEKKRNIFYYNFDLQSNQYCRRSEK